MLIMCINWYLNWWLTMYTTWFTMYWSELKESLCICINLPFQSRRPWKTLSNAAQSLLLAAKLGLFITTDSKKKPLNGLGRPSIRTTNGLYIHPKSFFSPFIIWSVKVLFPLTWLGLARPSSSPCTAFTQCGLFLIHSNGRKRPRNKIFGTFLFVDSFSFDHWSVRHKAV